MFINKNYKYLQKKIKYYFIKKLKIFKKYIEKKNIKLFYNTKNFKKQEKRLHDLSDKYY